MRVKFSFDVPMELDPYETSVVEIEGSASVYQEFDNEIEVASMSMYSVDYITIEETNQRDFFDIMDAISHSLMEIAHEFYDLDLGGLKDKFIGEDPFLNENLLHIEKLIVAKEFRGLGLGRAMFDRAMRMFGRNHGIVTVKPFPLQLTPRNSLMDISEYDFSDLPQEDKKASRKVTNIYRGWGFTRKRGMKYMHLYTENWFDENPVPITVSIPLSEEEKRMQEFLKRKNPETSETPGEKNAVSKM